jgi:hypothetical protein
MPTGGPPHPALAPSALRRSLAIALLGLALLLAQGWLAAHELEHLFHEPDEPCNLCLVGLGLGSPLPGAAPPPVAVASDTAVERCGGGIARQSGGYHPQAARAPPAQALTSFS